MTIHRFRRLLATGIALSASVAEAQSDLPPPGSRVRVTAPNYFSRVVVGQVVRATPDSITIDVAGTDPEMTLSIDRLSRLEMATGKRPALGFIQGAGAGFVFGSLAGLAFGGLQYLACESYDCGLWFIVAIPAGAGIGMIIGSIIGVTRPPDRWEPVSLPDRASGSGMLDQTRTAKFGLSISF